MNQCSKQCHVRTQLLSIVSIKTIFKNPILYFLKIVQNTCQIKMLQYLSHLYKELNSQVGTNSFIYFPALVLCEGTLLYSYPSEVVVRTLFHSCQCKQIEKYNNSFITTHANTISTVFINNINQLIYIPHYLFDFPKMFDVISFWSIKCIFGGFRISLAS